MEERVVCFNAGRQFDGGGALVGRPVNSLSRTQTGLWPLARMGNVLDDETQQQLVALGRLGWSLRRIEAATGVRRETAGRYLRAAGIDVRGR